MFPQASTCFIHLSKTWHSSIKKRRNLRTRCSQRLWFQSKYPATNCGEAAQHNSIGHFPCPGNRGAEKLKHNQLVLLARPGSRYAEIDWYDPAVCHQHAGSSFSDSINTAFVSKLLCEFDHLLWLDTTYDFRRHVWASKQANLVLRSDLRIT